MSVRFCMLIIGGMFLVGCGGGSDPKPDNDAAGTQTTDTPNAEKNSQTNSNAKSSTNAEKSGQRYVDGIPYDVFFDQPLVVAAENTTPINSTPAVTMQGNPSTTNNNMASNNPPAETDMVSNDPPPASTGGASWDNLISKDLLIEEVTRLRNKLNANMNSVGTFNRELLAIQIDGATLAALAGIAAQHSGEFTWKEKAKYVRDFSSTIAVAAESRGRPAFEEAEGPFLSIIEILNGGNPAELPDSEDETVFSDVADRNLLMKKISENNDWLRTTISTEKDFQNVKDEIVSRGTLIAALGKVVNQDDYVFADEDEYKSYCRDLIAGSEQLVNAAKDENYAEYEAGYQLLNKSCNDCHPVYLN